MSGLPQDGNIDGRPPSEPIHAWSQIGQDLALGLLCTALLAFWSWRIAESWGPRYAIVDGITSAVVCAFAVARRRNRAWCAGAGLLVAAATIGAAYAAHLPSEPGPAMAMALSVLVGSAAAALPARSAAAFAIAGLIVASAGLLTAHTSGMPAVLVLNAGTWLAAITYAAATRLLTARRLSTAARIRAEERLRLARELHDVVGHHLTRIVLQSQAAQILARTTAPPGPTAPDGAAPDSAPDAGAAATSDAAVWRVSASESGSAGAAAPTADAHVPRSSDRAAPVEDVPAAQPGSESPGSEPSGPGPCLSVPVEAGPDGPALAEAARVEPVCAELPAGPAPGGRTYAVGGSVPTGVDALAGIEVAGTEALGALRRVVGLLREGGDAAPIAVPRLADLAADFDGPAVRLELADQEDTWPPDAAATVYRIVQESLTNVARHAPRARSVTVAVTRRGGTLAVSITDDGPRGRARPRHPGYGLAGMRERVGALGGTFEAGPRTGGGWTVRATLPVQESR